MVKNNSRFHFTRKNSLLANFFSAAVQMLTPFLQNSVM